MLRSSLVTLILLLAAGTSLLGQAPTLRLVQDMTFGELAAGEQGGGIILSAEGILIPAGPGVQPAGRAIVQESRFLLTGPPHATFRCSVSPPTPHLTEPGGGRLRIQAFHGLPGLGEGRLDAQGQAILRLGAQLDIPAGAPAGTYAFSQASLQVVMVAGDGFLTLNQVFGIRARLRSTLRLVNLASLDFGSLIPGPSAGRFVVSAAGGTRTEPSGGPRPFRSMPRPAEFLVLGTAGTCYSIELPKALSLTGPGARLEVLDFHANVPLQASLPPGGLRFLVGASLLVPADQSPGVYRGLFVVSVDYL